MTRAVGGGFMAEAILKELHSSFAYRHLSEQDLQELYNFCAVAGLLFRHIPNLQNSN